MIKVTIVKYLLDQWITPDGKTITAKPPANLHGHHYDDTTLLAYILHHYYGCGVPTATAGMALGYWPLHLAGGTEQPDH